MASDDILEDDPFWYKDAVIYEVHVKAFFDTAGDGIGDFKGLTEKLDYLRDLGVTVLWLLPFYPSPLKDDGYDIADYFDVHPLYGNIHDFKEFLRAAHSRGMRVITELVLNHTSDQHPWFKKSRSSELDSKWRNFYVWSSTPDKYRDARIIFKDFEGSNWTYDSVAKAYYWHRFYSHQPDLNFDNDLTRETMLDVVDYWLKMGVDGLRLDAVPYLFEREGTNCENLPETHQFLKELRTSIDSKFKNRMLLAEANQWPTDAAAYFGNGDECHMAFHFPLMPRMFMALQMEDRFPIVDILEQTPKILDSSQWALFLRNHDELTLEMVTDEERDYMYRAYAKDRQSRINLGIRRRMAPLLGNDRRKIELMNVLLFTLPGTPVIYYGDEIGMGDNFYLGDRNGVRTPMQWSADLNAGFSKTNPQKLYLPVVIEPQYHYEVINVENQQNDSSSLLWWMKRIIAVRSNFKSFGRGSIEFLHPSNAKIIAYVRKHQDEQILVVANLSGRSQYAELQLSSFTGHRLNDVLGGTNFPEVSASTYNLSFGPYGYYIFNITRKAELVATTARKIRVLKVQRRIKHLFDGKSKSQLESEVLPEYLQSNRWFGGKGRLVEAVSIRDVIPINGERNHKSDRFVVIIDVRYRDGFPESYLLPIMYSPLDISSQFEDSNKQAIIAMVEIEKNPLGVLYDATYDDDFRRTILQMMLRKKVFRGAKGELVSRSLATHSETALEEGQLISRLLKADQSNTSIIYGDEFFLKMYRKIEEGKNPEIEIGTVLANQDFASSPRLLAYAEYKTEFDTCSAFVLEQYCVNQGDAWALFTGEFSRFVENATSKVEEVQKLWTGKSLLTEEQIPQRLAELLGLPFVENVKLLGRRTAEFHKALAAEKIDPEFAPEPFGYLYQVSITQSMTGYAMKIFQQIEHTTNLADAIKKDLALILKHQNDIVGKFTALKQLKTDCVRTRIHGDYHLGQVLYTGKDLVIIDFEGEPARSIGERRIKRSPIRDIAGMIRSFSYAAHSQLLKIVTVDKDKKIQILKQLADNWANEVSKIFLASYLECVSDLKLVPKDKSTFQTMMDAYLLEKAVYELGYELNNRPDLAFIPIRGIQQLAGLEQEVIASEQIQS